MNTNCRQSQAFIFFILLTVDICCFCYNLKNEENVESYIKDLTEKFETDASHSRFFGIIEPPQVPTIGRRQTFLLPKILLWSPQEQFPGVCMLNCPTHKEVSLKPWKWTNCLSESNSRRPRLIHDLFGNVLLVQRIYLCSQNRKTHKIYGTSPDLLDMLPESIRELFPLQLFQRSGCSKRLQLYIKNQIIQGVNFLKISEGIAALNHEEFMRLGEIHNAAIRDGLIEGETYDELEFYANDLFAFPSSDQTTNLFLDNFKTCKNFFVNKMQNITATRISCDHTFKISRNIGVVSEGEKTKFVTLFKNVFIVLNENGEIVDWRLTKSTAFNEISDVLTSLKERLHRKETSLTMICIDDCCKNRNQYQKIFPDAEIKLDLFHACQRVLRTIEPGPSHLRYQFGKEFGLIFRQRNDLDETRTRDTANVTEIEANLESLLERWRNVPSSCLTSETLKQIQNLREHIKKGCLSGIPPGFGTEKNEQIHRLLNRSLLTGATRISIELAVALLTVLFYSISCKASSNMYHKCNAKVHCIQPARRNVVITGKSMWSPFKTESSPITDDAACQSGTFGKRNESSSPELLIAEDINDVCTETVAQCILNVSVSAREIINSLSTDNCNRSYNPEDLLLIADNPDGLSVHHMCADDSDSGSLADTTITEHQVRLRKHLATFNRIINPSAKDGDCAFRSVVKMIKASYSNDDQLLWEHLNTLGLLKTEEEDIRTLRHLFAEEIMKESEEFLSFIPNQDRDSINMRAEEFKQNGVFDRSLGDLVMKVCAHVLKLPIMVVTSNENYPYVPFMPGSALTSRCIYVAYHYYGAGHYDATALVKDDDEVSTTSSECATMKQKGCCCGSRVKSRIQLSCKPAEGHTSRCPCVRNEQNCTRYCKCRHCSNNAEVKDFVKCRCGEGRKSTGQGFVSCADIKGERNTKCPCFGSGQGCTESCRCFNCKNSFGTNHPRSANVPKEKRKKVLSSPPSLKRQRGIQYMRESGMAEPNEGWTTFETCVLHMSESFLYTTCVSPTKKNLLSLYNFVITSKTAKELKVSGKTKSLLQLSGKLEFLKKRQEELRRLNLGIQAIL